MHMRMRRPPAVYCMLLTIAPTIGLVSFARQISKVSQIQQKKPPLSLSDTLCAAKRPQMPYHCMLMLP